MRSNNTLMNRISMMIAILVIAVSAIQAPSASAIVLDRGVIGKLQEQRDNLIVRERDLLRQYDDLNKQIDDINRRNDGRLSPRLDDLSRTLNDTYSNLRQVRCDLKEVEIKLL